jgi:membrane protein required for colicin V production
MPLTLLDIILLVVMLVSGLLAMIRGFMREILSIAAWILAAGATLYLYPRLLPSAKAYFNNDLVAAAAVIIGVFMVTLIVVSVVTVRVSDLILDSRVGALDRTLGFLFGLGRGLIIVVVAFVFFGWFVPEKSQPLWIRNAKSQVVLQSTGETLMSMMPDVEAWWQQRKQRLREDGDPQDTPPDQRSGFNRVPERERAEQAGYERSERAGLRQLIETRAAR